MAPMAGPPLSRWHSYPGADPDGTGAADGTGDRSLYSRCAWARERDVRVAGDTGVATLPSVATRGAQNEGLVRLRGGCAGGRLACDPRGRVATGRPPPRRLRPGHERPTGRRPRRGADHERAGGRRAD